MARSGLKKVTKVVRGKHGSVRRTYWVRGRGDAKAAPSHMSVREFARKHGKMWMGIQFGSGAAGGVSGHLLARHAKYGGGGDQAAGRRFMHGMAAGSIAASVGTTVYAVHKHPKRMQQFLSDYDRLSSGGRAAVQAAGVLGMVAGTATGAYASHRAHSVFKRRPTRQ